MIRWMLQRRAAAKAARRTCRRIAANQVIARAVGKTSPVWVTIVHNPDWYADSERAAVEDALREEQVKRGLR